MKRVETCVAMGLLAAGILAGGCGGKQVKQRDFSTSGSREADQRAEQRMAQERQLRGQTKKDEVKRPLYERLGGDAGVKAIVDDFVPRVLADPRVDWERKGETHGGFMGVGKKSSEWMASGENVEKLKQHLTQFIAVAAGGTAKYEGRDIPEVHKGMKITDAEFNAAVGDLKATMDRLGVGNSEQKELIAIVESTREQVVPKR